MGKKKLEIKVEGKAVREFYADKDEEEIARDLVELVRKKFGEDIKVLREN